MLDIPLVSMMFDCWIRDRRGDGIVLTAMVQVVAEIHIPVSSRRDMEVSLDLIPFQTPIYPTRILYISPPHPRGLGELPPRIAPMLTQQMSHMLIFFLRIFPPDMLRIQRLVLLHAIPDLSVHFIVPKLPAGRFLGEQLTGQDPVAHGILDVHPQRITRHRNHHVHVELQFLRNTLLHAEVVILLPAEP